MLVRHCNRCDKIIKNEAQWTFEGKHYSQHGAFVCSRELDLCEECQKKLEKFLANKE